MHGYKIVNLKMMAEEVGEEFVKSYLSAFSCPLNADVESYLKTKALDFAKQGWSQTHLVLASHKREPVMVGYFTLANKNMTVSSKKVTSTTKKKISKFAIYDPKIQRYILATPLIAQLGKNYTNNYNRLITGDELLAIACDKVKNIQLELGGRFVYLECEDTPKLIDFYRDNGFCEFDRRPLDRDETEFKGEYLVQMLKYLK